MSCPALRILQTSGDGYTSRRYHVARSSGRPWGSQTTVVAVRADGHGARGTGREPGDWGNAPVPAHVSPAGTGVQTQNCTCGAGTSLGRGPGVESGSKHPIRALVCQHTLARYSDLALVGHPLFPREALKESRASAPGKRACRLAGLGPRRHQGIRCCLPYRLRSGENA